MNKNDGFRSIALAADFVIRINQGCGLKSWQVYEAITAQLSGMQYEATLRNEERRLLDGLTHEEVRHALQAEANIAFEELKYDYLME
jgi:hypothetical protein